MIRRQTLQTISYVVVLWAFMIQASIAYSVSNPGAYLKIENDTKGKAREVINEVLNRYCSQFCELIGLDVDVDEKIPDGEDMGFESAVDQSIKSQLVISKIKASIQIDERVGGVNRVRLAGILKVRLNALTLKPEIVWKMVRLPNINGYGDTDPGYLFDSFDDGALGEGDWDFRPQDYTGKALSLRQGLKDRITRALNETINRYCPNECLIEKIDIAGHMVTQKEAARLSPTEQVRDRSGHSVFQIDNIELDITMSTSLPETTRDQITAIMRSKIRFASPINFNIGVIEFPETYASKLDKQRQDLNDPYGLNKLRNMLIMFRDLAGTREIINNTNTVDKSLSEKDSLQNRLDRSSEESTGISAEEILGGLILTLLVVGGILYFLMKVRQQKRDAEQMLMMPGMQGTQANRDGAPEASIGASTPETKESLKKKMRIDELKNELIDLFIENPKVAKETFSRFLKEDGVEETAKYVHVFGHLIVFELLKDPNFQRELYELSEYYHNSEFSFTRDEELDLLEKLKTRCTASEIRVLTRKVSEKFDFLGRLDSSQVYELIRDEKIQVQAIVLTQLDRKKRGQVFAMYVGDTKVALMNELSSAEAIPKDYLFNVAKVLAKKITGRSEFDTENLRTSGILLDLLEKAPLEEQKSLMSTLQQNNADTFRSLKMKLVSVQMLPYFKDGHLLELILGLDREDLLIFLSEVEESIRDLLLRKAPEELSDSWLEDLENMVSVDENAYRLVEMKILNRIRNFANNGVISLLDINSMIFDGEQDAAEFTGEREQTPPLSSSTEAA